MYISEGQNVVLFFATKTRLIVQFFFFRNRDGQTMYAYIPVYKKDRMLSFFSKKNVFPFPFLGSRNREVQIVYAYIPVYMRDRMLSLKKVVFLVVFRFVSKLCCSSHVCIYSKIQGGQNAVFWSMKKTVFLFLFQHRDVQISK